MLSVIQFNKIVCKNYKPQTFINTTLISTTMNPSLWVRVEKC